MGRSGHRAAAGATRPVPLPVHLDISLFTPPLQQQAKLLRTKVRPRPLLLLFLHLLPLLPLLLYTLPVFFLSSSKTQLFLNVFSPNPNRCILHPPQELRPKKMERDAWDKACDQVSLTCDGRSTVHQCFGVVACDVRCAGSCEENSSSEVDGRRRRPFAGTTILYSALFLRSAFFVYSRQVFLLLYFVL